MYVRKDSDHIDVRRYLTLALTALQHRGQESAGMAVYDHAGHIVHRVSMGKVREVFPDTGTGLPATYCGIGHVRYSTTGSSCVENAGPFVVGAALRAQLPQHSLRSTTDSEAIALLLLLQADGTTMRERMIATFPLLRGAY